MLKVLFRKSMQEVGALYFRDKKKGGQRRGAGKIGMIALYVFLFLLLAVSFAGLASLFFGVAPKGTEWIAWSILGIIAVLMSTLINAFTTYGQLYLAKDNELLLSLPVKPGTILLSRMGGVYVMGLIYIAIAWLPGIVISIIYHKTTAFGVVSSLLMMFIMGFMVLALTCLIGWLLALLFTKLKNQKFALVFMGIVLIGGLYFLQFKTNALLNKIANNIEHVSEIMKSSIFPFYELGRAASGNILAIIIFTAICAVLMFLAYLLLSRTFVRIATTKAVGGNAKFKESQIKTASVKKALATRERLRFTGSVTYMLNSGLGALIMIILAVVFTIKADMFTERLAPLMEILPELKAAVPLVVMVLICMIESMAITSAASVSLEGKNIWLIQTLPVNAGDVLEAKSNWSFYIQGIPGILMTLAIVRAMSLSVTVSTILALLAYAFAMCSANFGTFINVLKPRLDWTTESTPIKRGAALTITLFGGWVVSIVAAAVAFLLRNIVDVQIVLGVYTIALFGGAFYLKKWLKTTGAEIFSKLA